MIFNVYVNVLKFFTTVDFYVLLENNWSCPMILDRHNAQKHMYRIIGANVTWQSGKSHIGNEFHLNL